MSLSLEKDRLNHLKVVYFLEKPFSILLYNLELFKTTFFKIIVCLSVKTQIVVVNVN